MRQERRERRTLLPTFLGCSPSSALGFPLQLLLSTKAHHDSPLPRDSSVSLFSCSILSYSPGSWKGARNLYAFLSLRYVYAYNLHNYPGKINSSTTNQSFTKCCAILSLRTFLNKFRFLVTLKSLMKLDKDSELGLFLALVWLTEGMCYLWLLGQTQTVLQDPVSLLACSPRSCTCPAREK